MTESLRIAVADDEPDMRDYFAKILPRLGHRVVVLAALGDEALGTILRRAADDRARGLPPGIEVSPEALPCGRPITHAAPMRSRPAHRPASR